MSQDYAIQQQPSQTGSYATGLGLVGGGVGAAVAGWKPGLAKEPAKYASYADILKESHDDFVKNNEGLASEVAAEQKTATAAVEKAGQDYEAKLNQFLEENKDGELIETEEYKTKKTELETKKQAFETECAEKEAKAAEKIKKQAAKNKVDITEEQIVEQAKKDVAEQKGVVEKAKKIEELQKTVDEMKAGLKKGEKKTAEQLKEVFEKNNGTKEEAIKKATEDLAEKASDGMKKLLEKGKMQWGKFSMIAGAGVVAGAILGAIFAPKE